MDIFDEYKEDRVPHELLYVVARVGLLLAVNLFSLFASILLCAGISTVLGVIFENSRFVVLDLIPFLNNPTTTSVVGYLILLGIMVRIFWDDGKRHTAYGKFSMPVVTITAFVMFVIYVIPSIFFEEAKDSLAAGIKGFYKPSLWLSEVTNGSIKIPVVISAGLIALVCMVIYKLSGDRYLKKHPDLTEEI